MAITRTAPAKPAESKVNRSPGRKNRSTPAPISNSPLKIEDIPTPEPKPGHVLLKVRACGVCRTDLHITEGELPPRNPRTGEDLIGFQKKFTDMRRSQLPHTSPRERFDHFYRLATNTRVASTEQGKVLRVGDALVL